MLQLALSTLFFSFFMNLKKWTLFGWVISVILVHAPVTFAAFTDIPQNHTHFDAIMYIQSEGIVQGYADGSYKPDRHINRAEFTKIIVETITGQEPLEHAGSCFSDVSSGQWFYSYICYAKRMGIIGGYPDGFFKPANPINFVEAAKIISIANKFPVKADSDIWYKAHVLELEKHGAIPSSIQSFDQLITRGEMAEIIYRLETNLSNKPSQNYDALTGNGG